nr:FAD-binding protein [Oscillospiraceae bacterium]
MNEWKKLSCDVLVIGGGIGGLSCAVSVKERNPDADVLVVEKNFAGYAGKANRGGGVLQYFDPEKIDPKEFVAYHTKEIGAWFTDQELMEKYVSMNTHMLDKLIEWGANLPKTDGKFMVMPTGSMTSMIRVDLDLTLKVRRTAEGKGVRFMDKTVMADLVTDGERIAGATVFSVLTGEFSAISAKKVVLATGSQNYRMGSMWSSGRGDGIKAAYRAGAELRNAEFGNFAQLVKVRSHNEVVFGENFMYNDKGEHISENFLKNGRETDINSTAIREWYIQMTEGNGPVHLEMGNPFGGPPMGAGGPPMVAGGPPMGAGGPPMGAGGPPMGAGGPPM